MSGSTVIRQRGRRYELRLETPSISFAPDPSRPGEPTYEQRYHANAARRFTETLAPLDGPLDTALEAIEREFRDVTLLAIDDAMPVAHGDRAPGGPCRWNAVVGSPPVDVGWDHGTITLAFAELPDAATRSRLHDAITKAISSILVEHHDRVEERRRHAPPPSQPARFHYTRAADGMIEDLNGEPPGQPPAIESLSGSAARELCAAIAAIISIAELDGVVHANLDVTHVRVDDATVSIGGFGEALASAAAHPPEGNSSFFQSPGPRIDWTARQRYGLGYVCYELLVRRSLELPRTSAAEHDAAIAALELAGVDVNARATIRALLAWAPVRRPRARDAWAVLAAKVTPAQVPPVRREPSTIPDRLAAATRGILVPCWVCKRPALRDAGRNVGTKDSYGPDCCWWERERRRLRAFVTAIVVAIVALTVWCAR